MSALAQHAKARGLYQLYQDEKKHEDRTRRMLTELEANNRGLFEAKMKLVETLLDVQVRDELARQSEAEEAGQPTLHADLVREKAHHRLQTEVRANAPEARQALTDGGFFAHLEELAKEDDATTRQSVHRTVQQYVDPHMEQARRDRNRQPQGMLNAVAQAANEVALKRRAELQDQRHLRVRVDSSDRARRVNAAVAQLKRDLGDLTSLLYCEPTEYRTDIGRRQAAEHELRRRIADQRAEEERLLQERSVSKAVYEAEHARLAADVDGVCQQLNQLQRELEAKELDLKEMAAAQTPGSGTWANSTMQLEKDLAAAMEEEHHLKNDTAEMARTNDVLEGERATLEMEITSSIEDLRSMQDEYQSVVHQVEGKLKTEKDKLYRLREDETEMGHKINDYLFRLLHRREDVRQQKRDRRAAIATLISQISVEDRLQAALTARALDLQTQSEKAKGVMEHDIDTLNTRLERVNQEIANKVALITDTVETLTNLWAGADKIKGDVRLTAQQLHGQTEVLVKEWTRVAWEAASSVAQATSRVDHMRRENDIVLRQIAKYVMQQEDINSEGIDIPQAETAQLSHTRETLMSEAWMRSYREAKYNQTTRLLRDRLQQRARGDRSIQPLTALKHVSLKDRRARRDAASRTREARETALSHVRGFTGASSAASLRDPSVASRGADHQSPAGTGSAAPIRQYLLAANPATGSARSGHSPDFRRMVIDFIKKEIQPLYDNSQITKKRYVDIVSKVSSWFLETHGPQLELTEAHFGELARAIQEVITWQDGQRVAARGGEAPSSRLSLSPATIPR